MGAGNFTSEDWKNYATSSINNKSTRQIYSSTGMKSEYSPRGVIRESCDSDDHPNSTPIIIGLDVTGSMEDILHQVAETLGDMVLEILDRKPVSDPQIMFNAIGDHDFDRCPLQVTQFESDIRIAKQLTDLWFEEGGGGNCFESYPLTWYFAANHTSCDNFKKRGKKGFIFTMGDDSYPKSISKDDLIRIFGNSSEISKDLSVEEILTKANREWEIFHLVLREGWNVQHGRNKNEVEKEWRQLLGERMIPVSDYTKIPQIIVSILETMSGKTIDEVVGSWDGSTAVVVKEAIQGLTEKKETGELMEFN